MEAEKCNVTSGKLQNMRFNTCIIHSETFVYKSKHALPNYCCVNIKFKITLG